MYTNYENFIETQYDEMVRIICEGHNDDDVLGSIDFGKIRVDIVAEKSVISQGSIAINIFVRDVVSDTACILDETPYEYIDTMRLIDADNIQEFSSYELFKTTLLSRLRDYSYASDFSYDGLKLWDFIDVEFNH